MNFLNSKETPWIQNYCWLLTLRKVGVSWELRSVWCSVVQTIDRNQEEGLPERVSACRAWSCRERERRKNPKLSMMHILPAWDHTRRTIAASRQRAANAEKNQRHPALRPRTPQLQPSTCCYKIKTTTGRVWCGCAPGALSTNTGSQLNLASVY